MRTMKIGKSGIEASVVGIGAWAIGGDSMWGASDDAESVRTIHRARELGVTLLDTAPAYGLGHSEEVVGIVRDKDVATPRPRGWYVAAAARALPIEPDLMLDWA